MKILFITSAFAPYAFSESIVNSKLVMAFLEKGWSVHVISRKDMGNVYSSGHLKEWNELASITYEIDYPRGNRFIRFFDVLRNVLFFRYPFEGIRWARRALDKAIHLHKENNYDVIISRSPPDITHLVAYHISKVTSLSWIANWNDPMFHIWPEPYSKDISFITKFFYQVFGKKMINQASMNTFPSEEMKKYFERFFHELNDANTYVIPHIGFTSLKFLDNKKKKLKSDNTLRLCHAGNLSDERKPNTLFEALVSIKNEYAELKIELDLMGIESISIDNLINKYSLEENVKQIGSYNYFDAMSKMTEYDVLVIIEADLKDAIFLPSKMVDYAELGIPILAITPPNSCIDRLMKENGGGVSVDVGYSTEIQNGILELYYTFLGHKISDQNHTKLNSIFDPEKITNLYSKIIEENL